MEVMFQHVHQSTRDGNQSLASWEFGKRLVPQRAENSGGLNMDLENDWQFVQQPKDCRLWKPGVDKVGVQSARPADRIPGELTSTGGGKPFDREIPLQAIMFLKIN